MYFVFDIETIPDFTLIRNCIDSGDDLTEDQLLEEAREMLPVNAEGFLPPMYHQIICWVGLWIENTGNPRQQLSWSGDNEKKGLAALFDALHTYKDFGLVHHNGRTFDLPLITYRAMKHQLQMPLRLNKHEIQYRYSNHNMDLMDVISNYGASSWPRLNHLGELIDIPIKQTGNGAEVLAMYRNDGLQDIERYCHEDVMATYLIWLHYKYTIGDMNEQVFTNLCDRAKSKLQTIQDPE